MAVDINKLADRMKQQKPVGANRNGTLTDADPKNDGTNDAKAGNTTMDPRRFFIA